MLYQWVDEVWPVGNDPAPALSLEFHDLRCVRVWVGRCGVVDR